MQRGWAALLVVKLLCRSPTHASTARRQESFARRLFLTYRCIVVRHGVLSGSGKTLSGLLLLWGAVSSCTETPPPGPSDSVESAADKDAPLEEEREPIAHIPIGEMTNGSGPGEPGRLPALEIAEHSLKLGPFRIDRHPYPGNGQEPRLGVSQSEASALCSAREARLCTEAEWERACRGPASSRYPSGTEPCTDKSGACVSGFEVVGMTEHWEWTSSQFGAASHLAGQPVVKGGGTTPSSRRCASRRSASSEPKPPLSVAHSEVAFRCCYGAPNSSRLEEPQLGPAYEPLSLSREELRALLAQEERTRFLSASAELFHEEAARTVLARGPGDTKGFTLTTAPVLWQPARGSRFLVVAGSDGDRTSFVVAYHVMGQRRKLAASFVMKNEKGPIALAYAPSIRPRIHFSGCWGCPGETGKALFRAPDEVVMLQP